MRPSTVEKELLQHLMRRCLQDAQAAYGRSGRLSPHMTGYYLGMIAAYQIGIGSAAFEEAQTISKAIEEIGQIVQMDDKRAA